MSRRLRRGVAADRFANQLPAQVVTLIVQLKGEKPHWGARNIRNLLVRQLDSDVRIPAKSTIHTVLDRHAWSGGAAGRATARAARLLPMS